MDKQTKVNKVELEKKFVEMYNKGESKSKLILMLSDGGLNVSEIRDVFEKYDIKMGYQHVYNVLSKNRENFALGGNNTQGINKSQMIRDLGKQGKTQGEIIKELASKDIYVNGAMVYSVLKKEGYVKPKVQERQKIEVK